VAAGRKSKWPEVSGRLVEVEAWLRSGLTEEQVGKNLGISHTTFNDYKKKHPEFAEAVKRGRQSIVTELENMLVKRAMGYEYEEIKTSIRREGGEVGTDGKDGKEGREVVYTEKTVKHMPPDVGALAILLKNKAPDRYTNDRAMLELKRMELDLRKQIEEAKRW
jgi:hypothetical protein